MSDERIKVEPCPNIFGLDPSYGARCVECGAWLTKWDYTPEQAEENGLHAIDDHYRTFRHRPKPEQPTADAQMRLM